MELYYPSGNIMCKAQQYILMIIYLFLYLGNYYSSLQTVIKRHRPEVFTMIEQFLFAYLSRFKCRQTSDSQSNGQALGIGS